MTVILGQTRCEHAGCREYATATVCRWPYQVSHYCATHAREENYGRG